MRTRFRILVLALSFGLGPNANAADVVVTSPDRKVNFALSGDREHLTFQVRLGDRVVVDPSPLGVSVDGVELANDATIGNVEQYKGDESYPSIGPRSTSINRFNGSRIGVTCKDKSIATLDIRAFNDGVAFRWIIPGAGKARVPDESTVFRVPAKARIWYHDLEGHYEAAYVSKLAAEVAKDQWVAPPLTFRLTDSTIHVAITESSVIEYSGMALRADGQGGFAVQLGHKHPPSYPFRLRYAADVERMNKPASVDGTITTPWRIVIVGHDLNALIQSDIVNNLAPPPDAKLFPNGARTDWIKPGRAVWRYLDGGSNTLEEVKEFSRLAGELGFEYQVVEGFWSRWTDEQIKEAVDDSRSRGVGLWFWRHSKFLRTAEERESFFKMLRECGVVGAKIDFFDHEHREVMDHYQALLKDATRHKIMVNFHGANKPTGESRTWPNELIREGVRGMESSRLQARARHNTTLPFTRYLAGTGDYTPVHFGARRGDTTATHQIATAAVFNEPLLTYGAHPKTLVEHPAVEMIKCIPAVWDETIALSPCQIGELVAFARRSGNAWFLAVLNGPTSRTIKVPLSFLPEGTFQCLEVRDDLKETASVRVVRDSANRTNTVSIEMPAGGGYIARFSPATK
jgi:alpha-glucosidase